MELAVSILGIKENLKEKIDELNKTKTSFLHIDIMDGKFVPNKARIVISGAGSAC